MQIFEVKLHLFWFLRLGNMRVRFDHHLHHCCNNSFYVSGCGRPSWHGHVIVLYSHLVPEVSLAGCKVHHLMLITLWYCFIFSERPVIVFITYIEICPQDFMSHSYVLSFTAFRLYTLGKAENDSERNSSGQNNEILSVNPHTLVFGWLV